jgi:hypothetical protein
MPEDVRPDQPQPEPKNDGQSSKGSARPGSADARSDGRDDWRCREPPPYCGPAPPYWDPYCRPPPYYGGRYHWGHWPAPPMPDGGFFESMMRFAASTAGFRGRLWREMAEAARYAQRDYYEPYAPHPRYYDSWPPGWSYGDPYAQRPPPWSSCDPRAPSDERRADSEPSDPVNLKELKATLEAAKEEKLKKKQAALEEAESSELGKKSPELVDKLRKELAQERSKADAAIDAVIYGVKMARVAEATRRKKWSRGAPPGRYDW